MAVTYGEAGTASIRISKEQAAGGKQSLRFEDAPGLDQSWNPHIWYNPHQTEGLTTLSYDLRLGAGAQLWNEWRDDASPYRTGPSLGIDAAGQLSAGKQPLVMLPHDQWVHVEATWTLTVTLPGQQPQKFEKLPCDPKFKQLQWLGFVSGATEKTIFYVDNVKLVTVKPGK